MVCLHRQGRFRFVAGDGSSSKMRRFSFIGEDHSLLSEVDGQFQNQLLPFIGSNNPFLNGDDLSFSPTHGFLMSVLA